MLPAAAAVWGMGSRQFSLVRQGRENEIERVGEGTIVILRSGG